MLEVIFAQIEGAIGTMDQEVQKRRRVTKTDPVADATEYWAGELRSVLERVKSDTEMLSPAQYAKIHRTTPQTVSSWIRSGKLAGVVSNGKSYLIPRNAKAPSPRRRKAAAR